MDSSDKNETAVNGLLDRLNVEDDADDANSDVESMESDNSTLHEPEVFEYNSSHNRGLKQDAVVWNLPAITIPTTDIELQAIGSRTLINIRALSRDARTYELEKFKQKCMFIFNQESINGLKPRFGTKEDVAILQETFGNLGFHVVEYKNYTRQQILDVLEIFRKGDFTEYGCIAIVILTHGKVNEYLRAKDDVYSEAEVLDYFNVYNNPTLVTKPKILIIQACRGKKASPGVLVSPSIKLRNALDGDLEPYTLPVMADILIAHSSFVGEVSARNEVYGSWFIQILCEKIKELVHTQDLESILTEVKREVAADRSWIHHSRTTGKYTPCKQMPTVTSSLIRKLYLRKFEEGAAVGPVSFHDHPTPGPSSVLSVFDIAPTTPLTEETGPCHCFLDHFDYIKQCLTHYYAEKKDDFVAKSYLDIADKYEDGDNFNEAKGRMAKVISEHLMTNARESEFIRYVYFYKHLGFEGDYEHFNCEHLNCDPCTSRCCVRVHRR